ncbi:MAG: hypothetical protein R8K21_03605 [Mariprofundales bacterium]
MTEQSSSEPHISQPTHPLAPTTTMPGELLKILQWVETNGEVRASSRMRIKLMPATMKEKICLDDVDASTVVSSEYLDAARAAAEQARRNIVAL